MEALLQHLYKSSHAERLEGGDINQVFKVEHPNGISVLKINAKDDFPFMFEKEANGLNLLNSTFTTPKVLSIGSFNNWQYLELEYLTESTKNKHFSQQFAEKLVKTHQNTQKKFGFEENNFIGSLVQSNLEKSTWKEFLIEQRLQPMLEMAVNAGEVNYVEGKIIEKFYARIDDLFPIENPALLHGDLWNGNVLSTSEGPVLIDPAVYFGHREMDLAMMKLFGGFDKQLFEIYYDLYPLEKNWQSRIEYHQLYPLLVHLNLFGRSYWEKVNDILKQFT